MAERGQQLLIVSSGRWRSAVGVWGWAPSADHAAEQAAAPRARAPHARLGRGARALRPGRRPGAADSRRHRGASPLLNGKATLEPCWAWAWSPSSMRTTRWRPSEIVYGDNDRLAARVAQMIGADLLVLLSDVRRAYTRPDPPVTPAPRLDVVSELTPEIEAMAGGSNAAAGVGVAAWRQLTAAPSPGRRLATLITHGRRDAPLRAVGDGAACTLIEPSLSPRPPQAMDRRLARAAGFR